MLFYVGLECYFCDCEWGVGVFEVFGLVEDVCYGGLDVVVVEMVWIFEDVGVMLDIVLYDVVYDVGVVVGGCDDGELVIVCCDFG